MLILISVDVKSVADKNGRGFVAALDVYESVEEGLEKTYTEGQNIYGHFGLNEH